MREKRKSPRQEHDLKRPSDPVDAEAGLTLQQVAAALSLNFTTLSRTRSNMTNDEFLSYLERKSGQKWRFDRNVGRYGKYFQLP